MGTFLHKNIPCMVLSRRDGSRSEVLLPSHFYPFTHSPNLSLRDEKVETWWVK